MNALFILLTLCVMSHSAFAKDTNWKRVYFQNFESKQIDELQWTNEKYDETGRYSDKGEYFKSQPNFKLPTAFRSTIIDGPIKYEFYSREKKQLKAFYSLENDPSNSSNHVLRLRTEDHTDGFIVGSSGPLPREYKVCVKGGFASFGDGKTLPNGYDGNETALPWINAKSINENGHYWLAILTQSPRPRNNVWIHHHRKMVIDSDNNIYPNDKPTSWTRIWDGKSFVTSGEHPVMMFALDSNNKEKSWNFDRGGMPFISFAGGKWNSQAETGEVRAADSYLPNEWYRSCIWKTSTHYGLEMSGKFNYGGNRSYRSELPISKVYQSKDQPDFFMFGDPHINFYQGKVLYDDIEIFTRE